MSISLREKLNADLKTGIKEQNKELTGVVRMLISAIQYGNTAAKPLTELEAVLGYRKQLLDSLEMYPKGSEKHIQTEKELTIVDRYVPKAPNEAELIQIIKDKIVELSSGGAKVNPGMVMKEIKQMHPTCDGKALMTLIQNSLAGN